jgi:hypothetical protein
MTTETETILDCGHAPSPHESFTTGYGRDENGRTFCYDCAATRERDAMIETGNATLYLVKTADMSRALGAPRPTGYEVTDWPGGLRFTVTALHTGRHNIARTRIDAYFAGPDGYVWHGVQYGANTQIIHCKRTREHI